MLLEFEHTTFGQRVYFGSGGAVANVRRAVDMLGARRILLIASTSSLGLADRIAEHTPVVERISGVTQHVPVDEVEPARARAITSEADAIVTVGGGSATGLGKAVALTTELPIVAVPTTFAGSEATDVWGITESGRKQTGSDRRVLPAVVVYDPAQTVGLMPAQAAASSMNAVAHAVDGLWAPRSDPINRALGLAGLRALLPGLRAMVGSPDDLAAREQIMYGAYLTAVAFASAGSGLHHKICHVLGGAYDLPHAAMHSIVLPYVTAFNAPAAREVVADLAELFPGRSAAAGLNSLRAELGGPTSLGEIGLREEDIPRAVALILPSVPPSNPRVVDPSSLTAIIRDAWAGAPIPEEPR